MDGLTVGFAARELDECLRNGRIDRITQPERDTVILTVRAEGSNYKLLLCASPNNARCHLTESSFPNPLEPPALCMLLRKQLLGGRIRCIEQVEADRIVHVDVDTVNELGDHVARRLILEIMGRHSNLILTDENDRIVDATRRVNGEMSRVRQIQPGMIYTAPPTQDKLNPETMSAESLAEKLEGFRNLPFSKALAESVTGLSRQAAEELVYRLRQNQDAWPADLKEACGRLTDLYERFPQMKDARVLMGENGEASDVFPFPYFSRNLDAQRPYRTLSEALEAFFGSRDARDRLSQKSASMLRMLRTQVERCEKKLAMQEEELASAEKMDEYRVMGEAIHANLFQIQKGMKAVELPNWFSEEGGTILVPLDTQLTPVQNAQRYFKKYQKARNARETAAVQREKTLTELDYLEGMLLDVDKCVQESELEEIRAELVRTGYLKKNTNRRQQRQLPRSKPYVYLSADGIEILVGKNATQNDRLTGSARPDEMWLHAKDMPGSHVIIQAEGDIPEQTLREAAQLAAWYSKGQRSSMVPIDYTRRKYVKKPGGAAPGKVIYTHQKTAYMTVDESDIRRIRLKDE